jgi:hypothetical protein
MEISRSNDATIDLAKGWLFVVVGVVLVAGAIASGFSTREFVRNSSVAPGVVVSLNAGGSHPEIEFTPVSGDKVSYPQGGMIFGYQKGDRVRVLYNPKDPSADPCVDDFGALWFWSILPGLIGLAFAVAGTAQIKGAGKSA